MEPTFMGLETAKRALLTQQAALYTVGNNIANVSTPGYSRERLDLVTTSPYPTQGMQRPQIPGQIGTGVDGSIVQRIRDPFLDTQYRGENNNYSYYDTRSTALDKMQGIMNEPSTQGLANTMTQFWKSLQDLSTNPKDNGTRNVVIERGKSVAETFNYLSSSLTSYRQDLGSQLTQGVSDINSVLTQLNQVNNQISQVEPQGVLPNELYDQRDTLLDQLSKYLSFNLSYTPSGGNPNALAEGSVTVTMKDSAGNSVTLLDGSNTAVTPAQFGAITYDATGNVQDIGFTDTTGVVSTINAVNFVSVGSLKSLMDTIGYVGQNTTDFTYGSMLSELDKMANQFSTAFNNVYTQGVDINGNAITQNFFGGGPPISASNISVIVTDPQYMSGEKADGTNNALNLANVFNNAITDNAGNLVSFKSYYKGVIGKMGVAAQEADRMSKNSQLLTSAVDNRRQSVSQVSLDEEMTQMIQFQHAYNAAARNVTVVDEMLDKIINGMGLVGR